MTQQFENFVNAALDKSLASDVTLPTADDIPVFTGIGRQVTGKTTAELGLATTTDVSDVLVYANEYTDAAITKVWKDQGNYDVSITGAWPTSANTVDAVPIKAGFLWVVANAGTGVTLTGGVVVSNGDTLRALIDDAGNNAAHWGANEANLGYTPENQSNKSADFSIKNHTKFPSTQAVDENYVSVNSQSLTAPQKTQVKSNIGLSNTDGLGEGSTNKYFTEAGVVASLLTGYVVAAVNAVVAATDTVSVAIGKLQKQITDLSGSFRYSVNPQIDTTYIVQGSDVNQYGNVIIKCTNSSAIAVTLPNPNALTPPASVGDSFNIRQGGAGGITISGTVTGAAATAEIYTTLTLVAETSTTWLSVGG
jgi:hypothetical protein